MDEVLAIFNSATEAVKKYTPSISWDPNSRDLEPILHRIEAIEDSILHRSSNQASSYILTTSGSADMPTFDKFVIQGSPFVRLAGLSGASAVALGAYGAHNFNAEKQEMKKVYDTANFYHFVHTMALLAVPLTRRPALSGTLLVGGMSVFCGTIYYHALTEEKSLRKYTPYGGVLLILGWLSMVL